MRLPRSLVPLGYRNFALYWIGYGVSNTGKNIELTGAVWLVSILTPSPVLLGLLGIVRAVPSLILGPIAGVVADRVDRRRLLFTTQGLGLLASLSLGLLVAFGHVQLWEVYLQVAVQASITAFDAAARQTLFPALAPPGTLGEAVTLNTTAGRVSAFIGPAVGGLSIAASGTAAPFLLNAATFPFLMAAVIWIRGVVREKSEGTSSFRGELFEGLRHVIRTPIIAGVLKMEIVFNIFQVNPVMVTIIARNVLGVGPEGLGGLLSADALGSLFGLGYLLVIGHSRRQGRSNVFCTIAYAAALVGFGVSQVYVISFIALALTGTMDVLLTVTRNHILQLAAPPRMRGRVMGNLGTVTRGIGPLAQTQSGVVAAVVGGPLSVVAAAVVLAVNAAITARVNPLLWNFSRDDPIPDVAYEETAPLPP